MSFLFALFSVKAKAWPFLIAAPAMDHARVFRDFAERLGKIARSRGDI